MIDALRDAIWQFIGAIFAVIALVASIVIYKKQQKRKLLVWDATSVISLLQVHHSFQNDLKITLRDREVKEAYMATVVFSNRGNAPIAREDYDQNLRQFCT